MICFMLTHHKSCDKIHIDTTQMLQMNGGNAMKMRLDTRKIYLAMAEKGMTATEIAKADLVKAIRKFTIRN